MSACSSLDKLGRNSHSAAHLANAALNDVAHAKCARFRKC
jgi:hypothetical protein